MGPLLPVQSCFGGLAFYRHEKILGCEYNSIADDCEHVEFHKCIREKNHGRIFMNPAQILRYAHYSYFDFVLHKLIFNLFNLCFNPYKLLG